MQQQRRSHLTTGVVAAGVSLIAYTQVPPPDLASPVVHQQQVMLTAADPLTPYLDLLTNTATNLGALATNTLQFPILTQLLDDPLGSLQNLPNVINLLLTFLPEVSIDSDALPLGITVAMPPLTDIALAALSPLITVGHQALSIGSDVLNVFDDPLQAISAVLAAPATLLDALLNGNLGINVIGLNIPLFNGLLVPGQALDTTVSLMQLADNIGLGQLTLTELFSKYPIGDAPVANVATGLLDALGLGQQTPVDLVNAIGLGGTEVTAVVAALLDALGIGESTPVELVNQIGVGGQTVASVAVNFLDALGLGQQTPVQLLDALPLANVTVGETLAGLLNGLGQADLTVGEFVTELGFADVTIGDILNAGQLTNTSIGSMLSALGFSITLNDFFQATGGPPVNPGGDLINLMLILDTISLQDILANQGLGPDTTLLDILSAPPPDGGTPLADQTLTTLVEQNQTTIHDLLVGAGWGEQNLDAMVTSMLGGTTVSALLSGLGLNEQDLSDMIRDLPNAGRL